MRGFAGVLRDSVQTSFDKASPWFLAFKSRVINLQCP
jgi:hypothetical protein